MEIFEVEDLYCRLCADLKPSSELSNMVLNLEKCQEITDKLARFNIVVDFNDMLPKTVCLKCIESLERAYDFVSTVDIAQEAFKDYDTSVLDIMMDVFDHDTTGSNTGNDVSSVKPEESIPDDESLEIMIEIEHAHNNEEKENNSKSKSNIKIIKSKATTQQGNMTLRQKRKPKISKNVDLDTWPDYNWLCAFCDQFYHDPSELKVHAMQYHITCNPYRCFDCKARGLHLDNFVTHVSKHRPVLTQFCYLCNLTFETPKEMIAHKATHFDTAFSCNGCNTCFKTKKELAAHMKMFYKTAVASSLVVKQNDSLTCVMCEKTLASKHALNRHLHLHTDRKRTYICDTCDGRFYTKKGLTSHQFVHKEVRPHKCEVCKYSFKKKYELRMHALRHFGIKPFACEQCGKTFPMKRELSVHSAIHKDVRPYKCPNCTKSFRFRHLLVQHKRMHTGSKPYSCENCTLTFRNWSNYNKHSKVVHGVDNCIRKHTSQGLYAVDPKTKEVIYPDKEKVAEWKKKILEDVKITRTRKAAENSVTKGTSVNELDIQESNVTVTSSSC